MMFRFLVSTRLFLIFALLAVLIFAFAQQAQAKTYTICSVDSSETSFNANYFGSTDPTTGMRAKLTNPTYFGPGGTVAPEDFAFQSIATVNAASLANCNIFIGGGFEEGGTVPVVQNTLTPAEAAALQTWISLGGERFVVGGCDFAPNQTCGIFARPLTQFASGAGVSIVSTLAYNPLTCGGAGTVDTFGGVASRITPLVGDTVLATHNGGGPGFTGSAAAITDSLTNPQFLMTADADMYGSSGNATITDSPIASNPQAIFILNVFKFAADAMSGRLQNPTCFTDYNTTADLELAISTTNANPSLGGQTTITVEVANTSANAVSGVTAAINLPAGLTFAGQSGTGTYNPGTGVWTIGALGANQSVTITLTVDATTLGSSAVTAEITNSSLPDTDSAPNASFAIDDHDDGLVDDDEGSVAITTVLPSISGTIFEDNGAAGGAATAHDGQIAGAEIGIEGVVVEARDGTDTVIASTTTAADGTYTLSVPAAAAGNPLTIRVARAGPAWLHISDDAAGASTALPGLINASPSDGELTFTPAAGESYGDVDFGQIRQPTLTQDQSVSVVPGGTITLAHTYTATTNSDVFFGVIETSETPNTTLFSDVQVFIDVNGDQAFDSGDTPISGSIAVNEGDQVRLIVRVQSSSGAPQGSQLIFDIVAFTDFTTAAVDLDPFVVAGTAPSCTALAGSLPGGFDADHCLTNTDTVTVSEAVALQILKSVCNETAGATAFGSSNAGRPGDVLVYRLRVTNPSTTLANNIEVHDATPAFTTAFGTITASQPGTALNPTPANCPSGTTSVPAGVACTTTGPSGGNAGSVDWNCTGQFDPGAQADFFFQVQIDN